MERKVERRGIIYVIKYDSEDEDLVLNSTVYPTNDNTYNQVYHKKTRKVLARMILSRMDPDFDIKNRYQFVDHINGDSLDNRRSNLRKSCSKDNTRNHKVYNNNTTGFNGIHKEETGPGCFTWCALIGSPVSDEIYERKRTKSLHNAIKLRHEMELEYWNEELLRDQRSLEEKLEGIKDEVFPDERDSDYTCPDCGKTMTKRGSGTHKGTCKVQKCPCGQKFKSDERTKGRSAKVKLARHRKTCKVEKEGEVNHSTTCDVCSKTFKNAGILANHKVVHQEKVKEKCENCEKMFTKGGPMKCHLKKCLKNKE